jgi:hypothetical protein
MCVGTIVPFPLRCRRLDHHPSAPCRTHGKQTHAAPAQKTVYTGRICIKFAAHPQYGGKIFLAIG